MELYRPQTRRIDSRNSLERIRELAARADSLDDTRELLIEIGVLESAVADALHPDRDGVTRTEESMRALSCAAARAFIATFDGEARDPAPLQRALRAVRDLPEVVEESAPEGFTQYGLFPEGYLLAARELVRELSPKRAVCVGIRSIGTTLSAVVVAALERAGVRVRSRTVRPRGHPFARQLTLEEPFLAEDALHLIIDEGPGLSGSSFAAVAEAIPLPDERVVFLPSWEGAHLNNARAQRRWARHRKFIARFDPRWSGIQDGLDLSGGAWRSLFSSRVPVNAQHERRKLLENGLIRRFAGFGRWGRARRDWAERLASAGFQPHPTALEHGFVVQEFESGRPLERVDGALLDRVAEYLLFRSTLRVAAPLRPLIDMVLRHLPIEPLARAAERAQSQVCAVHLDAKLQLHEWIAGSRLWKMDAIDHGDDHFWPGPHDIAWDVAGALVELAENEGARRRLLRPLLAADPTLRERLPFYELAYRAHRADYCRKSIAADPGFAALAARYQ